MNTPPPAGGKAKSHKRQKLLRSDEILVKRKQRSFVSGNKLTNGSSPVAPIAFPNETVAAALDVPTAALVLIDLSSSPPASVLVADQSDLEVEPNTSTHPSSDVVPANADESSPQAVHPIASAITPLTSRPPKRSGASRLIERTHVIRRKKVIVLDDSRILGFLREPFTQLLKASGKTMIDAKGLKRVANSNFALSFNPAVKATLRRGRISPVPTSAPTPISIMVTQSQNDCTDLPSTTKQYDLPHVIPSHGTVETATLRRYLLEDIMTATVGESLVLLVSTDHLWYKSYKCIANKSIPLPLAHVRDEPFIQLKALVSVNCQLEDLELGNMIQKDIEGLLFGNGNGAIILHFEESDESLEVLWKEFFDNVETIQVWGSRPMKRRLYDVLHNLSSFDGRKALFQRLAYEVDGDRSMAFDLASAMAKKVTETANSALKKAKQEEAKRISLSLEPKVIKPFSEYVDTIVYARMRAAYGDFVSLTDPILTHDAIDSMVNECENRLPQHWKQLQGILGFDNSFKKTNPTQPKLSK
jgi:hypothetical protein